MGAIHFSEMLARPGRHVVITNKVSNVNRLLRVCERNSETAVEQVYAKELTEIAREFIIADNAWKNCNRFDTDKAGVYQTPVIIDSKVKVSLIYNIIKEGRFRKKNNTFLPEESVSMDTAMELCRIIDQIRSNSTTDAYDSANNEIGSKINVINDIGCRYEELLKEKEYYDNISIIDKMISIIESDEFGHDKADKRESLEYHLSWIKGCDFYIFDNEKFTETEEKLINLLNNIESDNNTDINNDNINKIDMTADSRDNVNIEFFRAYGVFNEVAYIADKIKNENISSGDVSVLYTDTIYEKIISGVFDEYGIKYELCDGCSAKAYELIEVLIALLDFALDDFSYKSLEKVARSKVIRIEEIKSSVYNIFLKCIREGIGWGIERYRQYINNNELPDDEKRAAVISAYKKFLSDICDIFENKTKCIDIYDGLIAFIKKYGRNKELLNTTIIPALKSGRIYMKESDSDNFEESVRFIKEYLENLRIDKANAKNTRAGMVTVFSLNNPLVLERKHNFIIGLSASQFKVNMSESPVLSDNELMKYLKNTQILARDMVSDRKNIFRDCVNSLSEGVIYMGYSTYDTTEFRDMAPASVYMEYFREVNSQRDIQLNDISVKEYDDVYYKVEAKKSDEQIENSKDSVDADEETTNSIDSEKSVEETEDAIDSEQLDEETVVDDRKSHMSSTALQTMLKCPLQYYYKYEKYIPEKQYLDNTVAGWLTPSAKGNLFHYTLQKYCDALIGVETGEVHNDIIDDGATDDKQDVAYNNNHKLPGTIDEDIFEESFKEALADVRNEVPFTSEYTYEKERDGYKEKIKSYIIKLHEKFNDEKAGDWRIIANECKFEFNAVIGINEKKDDIDVNDDTDSDDIDVDECYYYFDEDENENKLVIKFNGSIDRLDGRIDDDNKLHLRIIDYKTGKLDSKKKEIGDRIQIQHYIYARAALDYVNTDEGRRLIQGIFKENYKSDAECDIEDVLYVFPYEITDINDDSSKYVLSVIDEVEKVLAVDAEDNDKSAEEYKILPDDINEVILNMKGELNNKNIDGFMENAKEYIDKKCIGRNGISESKEKKLCEYCTYKNICRRKIK